MPAATEPAAKRCTSCRTTKNVTDFYAAKNSADGRKSWCKPCCDRQSTRTRAAMREKALAAAIEPADDVDAIEVAEAALAQVRAYEDSVDAYFAQPQPVYTHTPVHQARLNEPDHGPSADWRHRAACRDEEPELFHPVGSTGPALLQIEEAKAVCRRCSVMEICLAYALEEGIDSGLWGGMSEDERKALKRRAQRNRARASA